MSATPPAVRMRGISKRFGEVRALDQVSFSIRAGQVSALLGENGAGKTTLMQVLAGVQQADAGEVELDGAAVSLRSPQQAIALGVGMVHQHFQLVPTMTVAENVLLGCPRPRLWLGRRAAHEELTALAAQHSMSIDPAAPVWTLSVGQRQQVEILKVLHRGARVLILDEPTAVLTPLEIEPFFDALRALVSAGAAVALITHKLREVLAVASSVTVLRRGRVVAADLPVDTVEEEQLGALILGEGEVEDQVSVEGMAVPARSSSPGSALSPRLSLRQVEALGPRGELALRALDLEVGAGEVLGVAGVSGNGQRELAEVVVGLRAATSGAVLVDGEEVSGWSVRRRLDHGIGYVPEDRQRSGVSTGLSVMHNLSLRRYRQPPGRALCDWGALATHAAAQVEAHDIRVASLAQPAGQLSGGNAQKLILAREIDAGPRLLVAAQPTRGLDLGAAAAVRARLAALAQGGCAVLLISEELDELLELAHRVAVLYRGQVAGTLQRADATPERVGRLMLGQEASQ